MSILSRCWKSFRPLFVPASKSWWDGNRANLAIEGVEERIVLTGVAPFFTQDAISAQVAEETIPAMALANFDASDPQDPSGDTLS